MTTNPTEPADRLDDYPEIRSAAQSLISAIVRASPTNCYQTRAIGLIEQALGAAILTIKQSQGTDN
ncbi:MAG: hypothetical protein KME15_20170 [Drouetiella hepatica Uher 2000/2452]|jgi:hypothetical protein|uniref:Uncharacterized protein n=1 Tax=Drouetiella hepatica Uher 2000/2452 TaxID=904376 RepID=A0A951QFI4_9CYAN|nr:hypothetical protein [Drouetiella hepatica Uher 2000/2452]